MQHSCKNCGIRSKRKGMECWPTVFAPVHKSHLAQASIRECGFVELNHPPYSPDLAPSDYYLFRNLKSHLRGKRFEDDEQVKSAVIEYFDSQPESFFLTGIKNVAIEMAKVH